MEMTARSNPTDEAKFGLINLISLMCIPLTLYGDLIGTKELARFVLSISALIGLGCSVTWWLRSTQKSTGIFLGFLCFWYIVCNIVLLQEVFRDGISI